MKNFILTIDKQNIATLVFDTPHSKANIFSLSVMQELEEIFTNLNSQTHLKALFIESGKSNIFIAGADIYEIKNAKNESDILYFVQKGQELFNLLSRLPFPTIAIIDGACLGGGLELALACTYRIATNHEHTRLGLPEVNLGIIPGFGGTQRLYPLVGYAKAMELMVAGKCLKGDKALKLGLVDISVPQGYLAFKKKEFIDAILENNLNKKIIKNRKGLLWYEKLSFVRKIIAKLTQREILKKTKGHYPAPEKLIEVMQESYGKNLEKGLEIERQAITQLLQGDVSKNLIEIFLISEELKSESFVEKGVQSKSIHQSAVVGTGAMGSGIAWALNNLDIDVRLKVRSDASAGKAISQMRKIYEMIKRKGRLTEREVQLKMDKVTFTSKTQGFKSCDFVIEAVNENASLKKTVYAEFESILPKNAIMATNTSSLNISSLAKSMEHPERFVGMHFFNPVHKMPLVEIIAGEKTNNETIATVVKLSKQMGKIPIKVKESAGFLVNRILLPYLREASLLFEQGISIEEIDQTLLEFGMPMGPLTLIDEVGIDVGEKVSTILHEAYGERMPPSALLTEMHSKGWLGKKSQLGFYDYRVSPTTLNKELLSKRVLPLKCCSSEEILDPCILIMINEASRCLEEGIVSNVHYLDMAMVMGTGFPAFRGGLLRYADVLGTTTVVEKLRALEALYGKRFAPSSLLLKLSRHNEHFYKKII